MNIFQSLSDNLFINVIYIIYSILIIKYVIILSKKLNIIDYPIDKRKIHKIATPLIGFFYFLFSFFIFLILNFIQEDFSIKLILSFGFGLLFNSLIGLIDDRSSISPSSRLIIIIFIFLISISLSNELTINSVKSFFFKNTIILNSPFNIIFTTLCYLLLINSLNLSDGINGLAISVSIIWLILISFYSELFILKMNLFLIVNLLILFYFNIKSKIFLGSGGVNFLATYICFTTVYTYNSSEILNYEFIFLFFMIPGIDMMRVFLLRIFKGKNPFLPDQNHLHHYLIKNQNFKQALLIYCLLILVPVLIFLNFNDLILQMIVLKLLTYLYIIKKYSK